MLLGFGESSVLSIEDDLLIGEISTSPEVGVKSDEDDPAGAGASGGKEVSHGRRARTFAPWQTGFFPRTGRGARDKRALTGARGQFILSLCPLFSRACE